MLTISRRAAIAAALERTDAPVSGETLAAELGISRVAVGKHIAALRTLGYEIAAAPHSGYRLLAAPDACIPEEVAPRLASALWTTCEGGAAVSSTNDIAKDLARAGSPEGTLVVAASQSTGRGRFGRAWVSPRGGAYASLVLRPPVVPAAVAPLSLVVALGAARALERLGVPVRVKWPNDLLADGRKLGGILLEMAAEADRVEWVVVGIGINLADPGEGRSAWVGEFTPARAADLAAAVLDSVAAAYGDFLASGFGVMREEYVQRLELVGAEVCVRDLTGEVAAQGTVRGIDAQGALLVEGPGGTTSAVHAGEVTLRR